jgi:hypothetical protein
MIAYTEASVSGSVSHALGVDVGSRIVVLPTPLMFTSELADESVYWPL